MSPRRLEYAGGHLYTWKKNTCPPLTLVIANDPSLVESGIDTTLSEAEKFPCLNVALVAAIDQEIAIQVLALIRFTRNCTRSANMTVSILEWPNNIWKSIRDCFIDHPPNLLRYAIGIP